MNASEEKIITYMAVEQPQASIQGTNKYQVPSGDVPGSGTSERDKLMPGKKFPFIENFLIDAGSFWRGNDSGTLKSGLWSETDISGNERYLEASAVCLKNKNILLISLGIATYEEKNSSFKKVEKIV